MEILIVLAIVGVLASVAIANYSDSLTASRRTDGRAALLANAMTLEKCRITYGAYNNAACTINAESPDGYYSLKVVSTASSFTLTATPEAAQVGDKECTSIIFNNLGQKTGTGTDSSSCW